MIKNDNYPMREAIRLTKLWQEHGPNTYPLDIDKLIEGAIQTSDFCGSLKTIREKFESFEGCLIRVSGEDSWNILLNEAVSNERRLRFTHAHELGHFMCHREKQNCFEDNVNSLNDFDKNIELEANIFASWLLMPANIVRSEFSKENWDTTTLCKLGIRFECSLQASALRYVDVFQDKSVAFIVSRDGIVLWGTKSKNAPYVTSLRFGDDLPEGSNAKSAWKNRSDESVLVESEGVWSKYKTATESQYFDSSGLGYQYTCIIFE